MGMRLNAIYGRKSKATKKGESIENQIKWGVEHIKRVDPGISDEEILVFKDDGFSGKNIKRPGFTQLLGLIKQKKIKRVVVYRLDRISRSVGDFAEFIKLLEKTDTEFVSLQESFDTSSPMGRAMMQVTAVFAQLERETISERVTDNMLEMSLKGVWLGGKPPRGFVPKRILGSLAGGRDYSVLVIDEDTVESVKRVFEVYYEQRNLMKSTRILKEEGVVLGTEKYPSDTRLRNILTNPVYCVADKNAYDYFFNQDCTMGCEREEFDGKTGIMSFNRHGTKAESQVARPVNEWVIAKGAHPGIIPSDQWIAINDSLTQNAIVHPRLQSASNNYALLTGMLVCGKCGGKMYSQPQNSGRGKKKTSTGFTYICEVRKAYGSSACDCPSISGKALDTAITNELLAYCHPTSVVGKQLENLQKKAEKKRIQVNTLDTLRTQLGNKETKLKSILDKWLDVDSDSEIGKMLRSQMDKLDQEIKQIREEILKEEAGEKETENDDVEADYVQSVLQHFDKFYQEMPIPKQRDFLLTIIERIVWDGEKADIFLRGGE